MKFSLGNFAAKFKAKNAELIEKHGPDFDKPVNSFSLNKAEQAVVDEWVASLKPEIMALQGPGADHLGMDEPYYGAMGGGITYSFIPTSLGVIITVRESITKKELNVMEALDWHFFG